MKLSAILGTIDALPLRAAGLVAPMPWETLPPPTADLFSAIEGRGRADAGWNGPANPRPVECTSDGGAWTADAAAAAASRRRTFIFSRLQRDFKRGKENRLPVKNHSMAETMKKLFSSSLAVSAWFVNISCWRGTQEKEESATWSII